MWKGVRVTAVVAMAENRCIGKDGDLPWHISADLKRFKRITTPHPMIMGRKTFQSIGKPLPGRPSIVVTRDSLFAPDGVQVAASVEGALDLAAAHGTGEIMIVGGGQIYAQALPHCDVLDICEVHREVAGDTFFPRIEPGDWREVSREDHGPEAPGGPAFSFVRLERV